MDNKKRFIEESFPVKEVSQHSAKEKNIRHGHISTLHIWWARRPLASSRATNYAALIPAAKNIDDWQKTRDFIIEFSKWENSLNQTMIEKARKDILKANGGKPPKVLDPFAGGGAIPLEALRLGCETYSSDLNPVAVLIQKCTLEYPQKYGKPGIVEKEFEEFGVKKKSKVKVENKLLEDVKKWGNWVLEEVKKEIGRFYPNDKDDSTPVGYIWARTIPCQNPSCGTEIPLMRQYWLAKKTNKEVTLFPYVENGSVQFKIVGHGYEEMPADFDPGKGTVSRAVATCQVCGSTVAANNTRALFQNGKAGQRLVAVVLYKKGESGKKYRLANDNDLQIFKEVEKYLRVKREKLFQEWGIDPVPDEPTPEGKGRGAERAFSVRNYGMNTWGDLFNSRQNLGLITIADKIRETFHLMLEQSNSEEYVRAVVSYLSLSLSRVADYYNSLCIWDNSQQRTVHVFGRQTLPMVWDYSELNPLSETVGSWTSMAFRRIWKVLEFLQGSGDAGNISQSSSTSLPYADNYFNAICTDPPYYDNVPYSYLSDFFYVWLKRTLGNINPELFSTPLSPKKNEIVAYSHGPDGFEGGKKFFEDMLRKSFKEIYRVLKPDGIAIIVYAHKSTEGWETLINSLLDSGLIMTGAWPINTEMQIRLRANESAALASSIYIVARKMKRQPTGFYNDVQEELKKYLNKKLDRLWKEGIGGADFFIAAIGSAIEVFGKYEKVMDYEGNIVRADRLLQDVRKIATDYAIHQILHNGFLGEISDLTRFYVLYRWNFGEAKVHFDDANRLSKSCGIDLAREWNRPGFIKKEKEFIRVLGPTDRKSNKLESSSELIDILHHVLLLWQKSRKNDILNVLNQTGYGQGEAFYRVAQAISESLSSLSQSSESKEKKLLDGFLAGRERIKSDLGKKEYQQRFEGM